MREEISGKELQYGEMGVKGEASGKLLTFYKWTQFIPVVHFYIPSKSAIKKNSKNNIHARS